MPDCNHFELVTIEMSFFEYGGDHFGIVTIHQEQEMVVAISSWQALSCEWCVRLAPDFLLRI